MQSSAAVAVRALVMLACVVAIPALAMSGTSWSEVLKKFQDFRWPAILSPAAASPPVAQGEAPRFPQPSPTAERPAAAFVAAPPQSLDARLQELGTRLQRLGATYYVLERWGGQQQLYRCYCKVAVAGNADYTHCFEAVQGEPLQAMLHVLQQVETWREGGGRRAEGG
jgi:hypothetical protein